MIIVRRIIILHLLFIKKIAKIWSWALLASAGMLSATSGADTYPGATGGAGTYPDATGCACTYCNIHFHVR